MEWIAMLSMATHTSIEYFERLPWAKTLRWAAMIARLRAEADR